MKWASAALLLREAIRKLDLEGFVVMIPRRGTYVADISIKDINEVYEIRTSLDVLQQVLLQNVLMMMNWKHCSGF